MYKLQSSVLTLIILFSTSINAAYYTFEGTVSNMDNEIGFNSIENSNIKIGDNVKYIFEVDYYADGTYKYANGQIEYIDDVSGVNYDNSPFTHNYFYAKLLTPHYLQNSYIPQGNDIIEIIRGSETVSSLTGTYSSLVGGAEHLQTLVRSIKDLAFNEWIIGTEFIGAEYSNNHGDINVDFLQDVLISSLTLTSISDTNPVSAVPIPPAIWLFGTVMLGVMGYKRKLQKTKT